MKENQNVNALIIESAFVTDQIIRERKMNMNTNICAVNIDFDGKTLVIGTETFSGCQYKINNKKELLETVCNYMLDILDTENEYKVQVIEKGKWK